MVNQPLFSQLSKVFSYGESNKYIHRNLPRSFHRKQLILCWLTTSEGELVDVLSSSSHCLSPCPGALLLPATGRHSLYVDLYTNTVTSSLTYLNAYKEFLSLTKTLISHTHGNIHTTVMLNLTLRVYVRACVCACVRACVRACVCVCLCLCVCVCVCQQQRKRQP